MAKTSISAKSAWQVNSSFMLGISMGSQNHEGEALEAIVERINSGSFTQGVIDLADTLNRYRYIADGKTEQQAIDISKKEGDAWLERNTHILSRLRVPAIIHRWDEWLNHPKYEDTIERMRMLYTDSHALRQALDKDIEGFYIRNYGTSEIPDERKDLSVEYYLEELAVATIMLEDKPSLVMYPGKQLNCFRLIRDGKLPEAPASLSNSSYSRLIIHSFERAPAVNQNRLMVAALT
jgi:tRNA-dependent cyclodipeptide synthase